MRTRTTNSHIRTVARLVEKMDTSRNGAMLLIQIKKSRLPVTAVQSVVNNSTSRGLTTAGSSRNSRTHSYQKLRSIIVTTTSATPVG